MKRIILIIAMILIAAPCYGQATSWNINSRPNANWWSGASGGGDLAWEWAKAMDALVAGGVGGSWQGSGTTYYVNSAVATEGDGSNWDNAKDTIEEAYDLCSAGDRVLIDWSHTETLGTLVLDTEGVWIEGAGVGEDMAEIVWDGTGDIITISAASNTLKNISFRAGVHAVVTAINITADGDYTSIIGCEFPEPSTNTFDFITAIQLTTASDNVTVAGCTYKHADAVGPAEFIDGGAGAVQGLTVVGNLIYSEFTVAAINSDQTDLEVLIANNVITNMTNNLYAIKMGTSATGWLINNKVSTDTYATAIEAGNLGVDESTVWVDYGLTDVVGVPYFAPTNGITQLNATTVTAIATAVDGLDGYGQIGLCETNVTTTTVISAALGGFGNDAFLEGWSLICTFDTGGAVGTAPSGEIRDITDYVSATGTFTTAAWSAALTAGDYVLLTPTHLVPKDYGKTIFCDDGGSNGEGTSWETAKTTLAAAEAIAAAGDTILIGENHNQAMNAAEVIDVAGVTVIGMGEGDSRPSFDYDSAATELTLGAAGITIKNIRLIPSASETVAAVVLAAGGLGCTLDNVAFEVGEASGDEFIDGISVNAAAEGLVVKNCTAVNSNATAGAQDTWLNLDAVTVDDCTAIDNVVFGTYAEACVWGGAAIPVNVLIKDNTLTNNTTGQFAIEFAGAATGVIANNNLAGDTYGAILDPGSARVYGNMQTVGINSAAEDVPLIAGKSYTRRMLFGDVGAAQDIFSITGSPIIIEHMWGLAKVAIGGAATLNLEIDADDTFDYDLSTAVDIQAVDQGGSIVFSAALGEGVLTPQALGASGAGIQLSWFGEEGMLESDSGGDTGNIEWYMVFKPVGPGCEVIPQTGNDE